MSRLGMPGAGSGRPPSGEDPARRRRRRVLYIRLALYTAAVVALLVFRVVPALRSRVPDLRLPRSASTTITVSGLEVAPDIISRAVTEYGALYPKTKLEVRGGGTLHAIDDLLNRRADVAFMNRLLTAREQGIIRAAGDSVMAYAVALGGIMVVRARSAPVDSMSVNELRDILSGRSAGGANEVDSCRVYAPDPNLGLWDALTTQLDLSEEATRDVVWMKSEADVLSAVSRDPAGIGFVSTLTVSGKTEDTGWRAIRVKREREDDGAEAPRSGPIVAGAYPLHHYLYVSCLEDGTAPAAGFVTFLSSGRGQRWIAHEGFLPARDVLREVQIVSRPVGRKG